MDYIELDIEYIEVTEFPELTDPQAEDQEEQELALLHIYADMECMEGDALWLALTEKRARRTTCPAHVDAYIEFLHTSYAASHSAHFYAWLDQMSVDVPF